MKRIVFMGTPEFAVPSLEVLIRSQNIVGVVTQPDRPAGRGRRLQPPPIKVVAESANVPVHQPDSLRKPEAAGPLAAWKPDLIIVAAYGQILRPHVLDLPLQGCLNVHASLLPRWRGAAPIQHAILAGDKESGVSLMKMDEGLDTGPVFCRQAIPIDPRETAASLHDRLAALGAEMLARYLDDILAGDLLASPQDDDLATYAPMIEKQDGAIDWRRDNITLDRQIRAMSPWPGAFTTWKGQPLKILAARPVSQKGLNAGPAGLVLAIEDSVVVLSSAGGLLLERIQLAGKRATPVADFLRGHPDFPGSVLGR